MIRLKDILLEGPADPDEKPNRIVKHLFGDSYRLTNKRPNPQTPSEIIFTFSDGSNTQYIAKTPDWAGNFAWYLRKNDAWVVIPNQSIPKRQWSPEELEARAERTRIRQEKEARYWANRRAEENAEEEKRQKKLKKLPNIETDWELDSTGDDDYDVAIKTFLSPRAQKIVFMRHKGYTDKDISLMMGLSPQRISTIYKKIMSKLQADVAHHNMGGT